MNYSLPTLAAACLALATLTPSMAEELAITEFDRKEAENFDWRVVDDGVMGGLSKGKISVSETGILNFSGNLSLENNGGFSSLRSREIKLDLSGFNGLLAKVRGDGRTYQLRLSTNARYRGMEVSFMAEFPTTKGEWTQVRIPFNKLEASFRGMKLKDVSFDPAKITRIGLLLGDKKTGPFELEVDWIHAYKADQASILPSGSRS